MNIYKQSVKNKTRVEGSICEAYLHHETTYLVYYFPILLSLLDLSLTLIFSP